MIELATYIAIYCTSDEPVILLCRASELTYHQNNDPYERKGLVRPMMSEGIHG